MERIRTGSIYEIAAVLRELYLLKLDKDLSFGEKRCWIPRETYLSRN
jgi:CarD family transcriptional regulator